VRVVAPVPPFATSRVPVRDRVDPDAVVVSPVVPPLTVIVPEDGVAVVASSAVRELRDPVAEPFVDQVADCIPLETDS
jgi:hypothetical protein